MYDEVLFVFRRRKSLLSCAALIVSVLVSCTAVSAFADNIPSFTPGLPVPLILDPTVSTFRVSPESHPERFIRPASVTTITVSYVPAGSYGQWGDLCEDWPADAKTALEYAAGIWAGYLNSSLPIVVEACWTDMGSSSILGYGGANNSLFSGIMYPQALANILYGYDQNGTAPEIAVAFNKTSNWYFGTDGNPGGGVDFVSVVLHEICHGLGFMGSMSVSNTSGSWGFGLDYPMPYDQFAVNGAGQSLINTSIFDNPSNALYLQLISNNVFFNGANATAANGGSPAKLYAPSPWSDGPSYAHLDYDTYILTQNSLMVYKIFTGSAIHAPGPVILGILRDVGWTISSGCTYSLTPLSKSFALNGGTDSVTVTSETGCPWTAASNDSWIHVTSGSSGTGNGSAGYSVDSYTGTGSRTGTMTIGGQTFTVTQTGCSYTLTPDHQNFNYNGGTTIFTVAANGGSCPWSPSESLSWVTVNSGTGPGNGTVNYTVDPNSGASSRSGNINIADKSFIITQTGLPPVANFSGAPLAGNIVPFQVTFTDLSNNSPTSWSWSFGDGGTSTSQNPVHTFKSTGPYDVSLTVTNANGASTLLQTEYVSASACTNDPVRKEGNPYTSIQAAYVDIADNGTADIDIQAVDLTENLSLGGGKTVTLRGGFTCYYASRIPETIMKGNITISGGTVIFDLITIQ